MTDVAMCLAIQCQKRVKCYRYLAKTHPIKNQQEYMIPTRVGEKCEEFVPAKMYNNYRDVEEVDRSIRGDNNASK